MRFALAVLVILLSACSSQTVPAVRDSPVTAYPMNARILGNREVYSGFVALVRQSAYGRRSDERAAFVVLEDGRLRLVEWPARNHYHASRWEGAIPAGTIAIAHTHPANQPSASVQDCFEAQRLGIPIFVLTPESVVLIRPRDGEQEPIGGRGWLTMLR